MSWDHQAAVEQLTRPRSVLSEDHAATLSALHSAMREIERLRAQSPLGPTRVYMPIHEIRLVDGLDEDGVEVTSTSFIQIGEKDEEGHPETIPLGTILQMLELAKLDAMERFGYFAK